jgi:hypothetical protein
MVFWLQQEVWSMQCRQDHVRTNTKAKRERAGSHCTKKRRLGRIPVERQVIGRQVRRLNRHAVLVGELIGRHDLRSGHVL